VVSYDAVPGAASRIAARFATASAVAFPDIRLPRRHVTGAPVRAGVRAVDRDSDRGSARATLGLPADRFCVAVFGGSLGSGLLNTATSELVQRWTLRSDVAVRHVVGERFLAAASPPQDGRNGMLYQVIGYEERMPLVYAAVDLVVARAGAGTVAELAAVGVPSLLVPWAGAADDHQSRNARWLADAGGATIVSEQEFDAGVLGAEIDRLRAAPAAVAAMAAAAREAGAVHRSGALADLIEDVAR
jgi:UDP-N-acetylglucosamine--N-acetylmuramyl-(pentapeptide) pyrophosphoryl-undecaprenol N-acetylglucosamine transferase